MKKIVAIIMVTTALALTVVSFILLPDTVITQFSAGDSGATTMPKTIAVLLPALLGIGGGASSFFSKNEDGSNGKGLIVSAVGIAVFAVMLFVNL